MGKSAWRASDRNHKFRSDAVIIDRRGTLATWRTRCQGSSEPNPNAPGGGRTSGTRVMARVVARGFGIVGALLEERAEFS
jgi:hypothetical protein